MDRDKRGPDLIAIGNYKSIKGKVLFKGIKPNLSFYAL